MYRVILLIVALLFCASPCRAESDLGTAFAGSAPAVSVNFDGSRHVDVCHGKQSQAPAQNQAVASDLAFDKSGSGEYPSTPILVGVGVAALAVGVAARWGNIAKTVTAVH